MNELALFAGAGGGILGGKLLGWRCVCAVEIEEYCREVLIRRQNEGHLPPFPIWDDVQTFDGYPWRGRVDVISAGFPCTDISPAGKGAGIEGERSSLWRHAARLAREVQPQYLFVENSARLTSRGLGRIVDDLAALGYGCRWCTLGADALGFPHHRARLWLVANTEWDNSGWEPCDWTPGRMGRLLKPVAQDTDWEDTLRLVRRKNDGVARVLDRTNAIRNGQLPAVAAAAWRILGGP